MNNARASPATDQTMESEPWHLVIVHVRTRIGVSTLRKPDTNTNSLEPKMTQPTQAVLRTFLVNPDAERFGLDVIAETGMVSGTLYPILARLEKCGWLQSRLEDVKYEHVGRRSRRYFKLTQDGAIKARAALDKADSAVQERRDRYASTSSR